MSRIAEALSPTTFGGSTFDPKKDGARLSRQLQQVLAFMHDGNWRTLSEISVATGAPQQSVSARLRDLRKPEFGGYTIDRWRNPAKAGLYAYRLRVK